MSGNSVGSSSRIRHPPAIATTTVAMPISTPARRAVDGVGCIASAIVADGGGVPAHPLGMSPRHPGRDDRRGMTCSQTSSTALIEDLVRLAAIPSISAPGYPQRTHAALGEAYDLVAELLRDAGLQNVAPLELPGTAPASRGDPRAARRSDRAALQPLRRRPGGGRVAVDVAAVRADRARRRAVRPRHLGLQGRSDRPRRRAARVGRPSAGGDQGDHRRPGGGRRRGAVGVSRRASGRGRLRRDGDRRHGQRAPGRADRGAARDGDGDDRGDDLEGRQAQRPVRRRRAGCPARRPARSGLAARRQRRRGRRGPRAPGVDGRVVLRRRVPRAGRGPPGAAAAGDGRLGSRVWSGPAITVPGSTCRRWRTRSTRSRRTRGPSSTCGCIRGRMRPRRRLRWYGSCRPCGRSGSLGRCTRRRPATGSRPIPRGRRTRRRARRCRRHGGCRRSTPRAAGRSPWSARCRGGPGGRGAARRRDRRLFEHPRARRAGAALRAREGDAGRGEVLRRVRGAVELIAMTDTLSSPAPSKTVMERVLDRIERLGNRMPDPAILFLWLCLGVILLSQALAWLDVKATYQVVAPPPVPAQETYYGGSSVPVYVTPYEQDPAEAYKLRTETTEVKGLLTVDGVRFLFTSFVDNFRNFAAVAIILVVMIGVGLAESAGLIGALIRKLVAASSPGMLTFIIVLLGMISSVASDAGYIVLIPTRRSTSRRTCSSASSRRCSSRCC